MVVGVKAVVGVGATVMAGAAATAINGRTQGNGALAWHRSLVWESWWAATHGARPLWHTMPSTPLPRVWLHSSGLRRARGRL